MTFRGGAHRDVDTAAVAPRLTIEERRVFGPDRVRQLVGHHRRDEVGREHVATLGEEHPRERQQVGGGGDVAAGAGGERRLARPLPVGLVRELQLAAFIVPIVRRAAVGGSGREREPGVGHAERAQDAFCHVICEGLSAGPGDEHAQDVECRVVREALTGLVQQGTSARFAIHSSAGGTACGLGGPWCSRFISTATTGTEKSVGKP